MPASGDMENLDGNRSLFVGNDSVPPTHLLSDYVEIGYLALIIALGTPINLYILVRLIRELKGTRSDSVKGGFLLMKINLNLSDLLLLLGYCVWKLAWLATYSWEGGIILCKVYSFLIMMALYLSSNVVVCIAFDRLRNVISANKLRRHAAQPVHIMLTLAWTMAIVWSLPQIYIWTTFNVYQDWPGGWYQCIDMWSIEAALNQGKKDYVAETIYQVAHLVLVFWGPLLILVFAYIIIAIKLLQYSLQPATHIRDPPSPHGNDQPRYSFGSSHMSSTVPVHKDGSQTVRTETNKDGITLTLSPATPLLRHQSGTNSTQSLDSNGQRYVTNTELNNDSNCVPVSAPPQTKKPRRLFKYFSADSKRADSQLQLPMITVPPGSKPEALESGHGLKKLTDWLPHRHHSTRQSEGLLKRPPSPSPSACSSINVGRPRVPAWRRQLRSKVFRTTLLVVLTHILFWLPYNIYALSKYVNADIFHSLNDHANIFKDLQIIITLINPFLYGFSQGGN